MTIDLKRRSFIQRAASGAGIFVADGIAQGSEPIRETSSQGIHGCLQPHPENGRYFADGAGRAIYLVGSHLGWELQDDAWDKQITFDFNGYLDLLSRHGHNLIRMWCVEHTRTDKSTLDVVATSMPFARTGPGLALDGRPKFDLDRFDETYFHRLRERKVAASERGIYVMVMLFQGWSYRVQKKNGKHPWPTGTTRQF